MAEISSLNSFETIEAAIDFSLSKLKDFNYVEFCGIAVKKFNANTYLLAASESLSSASSIPFRYCNIYHTKKSLKTSVRFLIQKNYDKNFYYGCVDNEKDYLCAQQLYAEDMFINN